MTTERRPAALDVVDAQFHIRAGIDEAIAAMDAVGVEAAVLDVWPPDTWTTPQGATRFDNRFAEAARARHPGRFAYVERIDSDDPEVDDLMAAIAARQGAACVRIGDMDRLESGGHDRLLAAARTHDVPVMAYVAGQHDAMLRAVRSFDEVQFIIDHCGMSVAESYGPGGFPEPASHYIDALMPYAEHPNVAVKWAHAPRLSRQPFPYPDVREQLARVIDAFGAPRVMWGSDYTVTRDHHTYAESLFSVRESPLLSTGDKEWVLGATLRRVLRWPAQRSA